MFNNENARREYKRRETYWVDFPIVEGNGSVQSGLRPGTLVQNDIGNKYSTVLQFVAWTTSDTKAKLPTHVNIDKDNYENIKESGLMICEQVISVPVGRVKGYITTLNDIDCYKLDKALKLSLQLDKVNSKIGKEIDELVEEIIDIEKFATRSIKRGDSLLDIKWELSERLELINKFIDICNKYNMKFYLLHDYKIFDREMQQIIRGNSLKFA